MGLGRGIPAFRLSFHFFFREASWESTESPHESKTSRVLQVKANKEKKNMRRMKTLLQVLKEKSFGPSYFFFNPSPSRGSGQLRSRSTSRIQVHGKFAGFCFVKFPGFTRYYNWKYSAAFWAQWLRKWFLFWKWICLGSHFLSPVLINHELIIEKKIGFQLPQCDVDPGCFKESTKLCKKIIFFKKHRFHKLKRR